VAESFELNSVLNSKLNDYYTIDDRHVALL